MRKKGSEKAPDFWVENRGFTYKYQGTQKCSEFSIGSIFDPATPPHPYNQTQFKVSEKRDEDIREFL